MKKILSYLLLLIANHAFSQETGTYQSDSIYKANHVKARLWYSGTNKQLGITTFYDTEGRLIKYQLEPFMDGAQRSTYYTYDSKGLLVSIADTTKNGEPDKKQMENLKRTGLDTNKFIKKRGNRPAVEISKYELSYANDHLLKITKYNPDGSLDIVDHFENNGKKSIRDWYRNGTLYEQSTTEYVTKFHKEKYYGWEIRDGKKSSWNYTFKYEFENGRVKSFVRYDGATEKETTRYYYDDKGLLIKTEGYYVPDFFEYVFY